MKKIIITICTFLFNLTLYAQKVETIKVNPSEYAMFIKNAQYKYPEYTRGRIYFKNGEMASARLNYDYFDQSMKYIGEKGDTLVIANEQDLNYIAFGTDSFFYDNGYYEWVASSTTARLAMKMNYKVGEKELIGAFGTSSPAKHIESKTKILGPTAYDLSTNEITNFTKTTTYYISPINGAKNDFVIANRSNINKLFKKKNVEDFFNNNRINLNKEEDLIDLMVYISKK